MPVWDDADIVIELIIYIYSAIYIVLFRAEIRIVYFDLYFYIRKGSPANNQSNFFKTENNTV